MKSVKELREKEADRSRKRSVVYSASEGRANFAQMLEQASIERAIIGFDRYGRVIAALVPVDAVRILAGDDAEVDPETRVQIKRMARLFLNSVPGKPPLEGYDDLIPDTEAPPKRGAVLAEKNKPVKPRKPKARRP